MRGRLRRLHVEGRPFVWRAEIGHLQGAKDCHRCIRLRVWGNGKNSSPLQADLVSTAWPGPWGACATDGTYPTPADVRAVIDYALAHGWRPEAGSKTFFLTEREHDATFRLPEFLLTDRRLDPDAPDPSARVIEVYERRSAGSAVPSASGAGFVDADESKLSEESDAQA